MKQKTLEELIFFFSWISGILVSLTVGYAVWSGSIHVPEILGEHLFSNTLGWTIGITTIITIILSFFRK